MAALLSSLYVQSTGIVADTADFMEPLPEQLQMLPEFLGAAGFQTAAALENPVLDAELRYNQGFDAYLQPWTRERPRSAVYLAKDWLRSEYDPDRPFFLWVHLIAPHAPYEPRKPFHEMFVGDAYYDPSRKVALHDAEDGKWDAFGGFSGFSRLGDRDELDYYIAQYDAEIRSTDARIADLLESLSELGLSDTTLVILTSDHGEGFGEHDYYWHGQVPYEEGVHVPLIFRMPGGRAGTVEQVVSLVDLTPTVLDVVGVPLPDSFEGRSLLPLLEDPSSRLDRTHVFSESGKNQRAIRSDRFKLVHVPDEADRKALRGVAHELYDLERDRGETRNLTAERPEVRDRLSRELARWKREASPPRSAPPVISDELKERIRALGYGP
jgi:arylsulfatase A-like enzyme